MNIVYLSQVFPPDPGPSLRALEQAHFLQKSGHNVTVITTMSYYPSGRISDEYRGKLHLRENMSGVDVIRVWSLPAPNRGVVRRMLSQISFGISSLLAAAKLKQTDLIIASTHIFAIEIAAIILSRMKRSKSLIELRDLLPESLGLTGVSPTSLRANLLKRYFDYCFRKADFVAVPCKTMIPHLLERGVGEDQIVLLPHGSDKSRFAHAEPERILDRHRLRNKFVVMYAGSFSSYYDVPNILRAANIVTETHDDIAFVLIGEGHATQSLERLRRDARDGNIVLTGHIRPDSVAHYLCAADLCITSLTGATTPDFYRNYPTTKICEYLMAGKPVLAVENVPVMGEYLERIGAGESVNGGDPQALARAIINLRSDRERLQRYSRNAHRHACAHMDRPAIVKEFDIALSEKMERTK